MFVLRLGEHMFLVLDVQPLQAMTGFLMVVSADQLSVETNAEKSQRLLLLPDPNTRTHECSFTLYNSTAVHLHSPEIRHMRTHKNDQFFRARRFRRCSALYFDLPVETKPKNPYSRSHKTKTTHIELIKILKKKNSHEQSVRGSCHFLVGLDLLQKQ